MGRRHTFHFGNGESETNRVQTAGENAGQTSELNPRVHSRSESKFIWAIINLRQIITFALVILQVFVSWRGPHGLLQLPFFCTEAAVQSGCVTMVAVVYLCRADVEKHHAI